MGKKLLIIVFVILALSQIRAENTSFKVDILKEIELNIPARYITFRNGNTILLQANNALYSISLTGDITKIIDQNYEINSNFNSWNDMVIMMIYNNYLLGETIVLNLNNKKYSKIPYFEKQPSNNIYWIDGNRLVFQKTLSPSYSIGILDLTNENIDILINGYNLLAYNNYYLLAQKFAKDRPEKECIVYDIRNKNILYRKMINGADTLFKDEALISCGQNNGWIYYFDKELDEPLKIEVKKDYKLSQIKYNYISDICAVIGTSIDRKKNIIIFFRIIPFQETSSPALPR